MRGRGAQEHAEALARRLELLRVELGAARTDAASPERAPEVEEHTRIRPFAPIRGGGGTDAPPSPHAPARVASRWAAGGPGGERPTAGRQASPIPVPGRHAARRPPVLLRELRGRVALGTGQLVVVAVLAVVGLAITGWWALGTRSEQGQAPVPAMTSPLATAVTAPLGPSPPVAAGEAEVVIDVAGKVRRPGIVVLPPGSRVVDALAEAGGARRGVDLSSLNLARVLVDGEQIVVGARPPPGVAASAAPQGSGEVGVLVNLNTAGLAELDDLPGVGPVTAQAIVAWREANGGFRAVDQLLEVDGIGEKTLADLAPHVTL